jgi:hypothetical protein
VVVRCNNMVLTWLVRDACVDQFDEEEGGDEEEEGGGVVISSVGEQKEEEGDEGCKECESFPSADFCRAYHRWFECISEGLCARTIW